jgi:Carboxypeptidase regulatory-like domain/TonB dependent receptor
MELYGGRRRLVAALLFVASAVWGAVTGSVSGTVTDQTGAIIPGATITVTNIAQGVQRQVTTNGQGIYTFPSLPVGTYDIQAESSGFRPSKRTGVVVDADSVLTDDFQLQPAEQVESVDVTSNAAQVETASTQVGEVVTGTQMTEVALNGRSYTDLLALQPGIVPTSTQLPNSIVMAGVTTAIAPSGNLNAGNQSISGQREDANGYIVNGGDVKELMNGGTLIVPNLDSIAEFRVITNNSDAQYGNYAGGIVNVVTKQGSNAVHGDGFEFLRNTDLDSRNFFSPTRGLYRQNQFGGTVGGPVKKDKIFYFADYQGTRTFQGVDSGLISVPTLAERQGDFSGEASQLTGSVSGPYIASQLQQKLGYGVSAGEPYYFPGCTTPELCVLPNAQIPQQAWSAPARFLEQYIPLPNDGPNLFTSGAYGNQIRDDKFSGRIDDNTSRFGLFTGYYFFDDYNLKNPYPTGQGGSNVPGFGALNLGRAQLISLGNTKTFGASIVNEARLTFMRSANNIGKPDQNVGTSLYAQGFAGPGDGGIYTLAPSIVGPENIVFNEFVMGMPITNLWQANNTFTGTDNFSRVMGRHTLKAGMELSFEQVNVSPDATFNGTFSFTGSETGLDFADFLIGAPSNFTQTDSENYYPRHKYLGAYVQDSWKATSKLTLNLGVRYELMEYWSEKYNQIPEMVPGQQSQVYPTAFLGLVYPTDKNIPSTLVPLGNRFSPRVGVAYAMNPKTSIRAGYGIYYSVIEGNSIGIDEPQPPYGLSYTSPAPPLFAQPYVTAATGTVQLQPYPINFPPLNATVNHPNPNINYAPYVGQSGMTEPPYWNTYPYTESYFLSIERELARNTVVNFSYVGSEAHHLLLVYSNNPGNPAECLYLSNPANVYPGTATCGPFAESGVFETASGQMIYGTRSPFGFDYGNDDWEGSIGNSAFNAFETSLRHTSGPLSLTLSYTFSKSMDQASALSDPVDPFNYKLSRALSQFDLTQNFVATYRYALPLDRISNHAKALTRGWAISGITRISTGFPVMIHSDTDNSLEGSEPNGVNNYSIDRPDYTPGNLMINHHPQNGLPYFNTSLFSANALGTPGTSARRFFYGPGEFNFDLALLRNFAVTESKTFQFRFEAFNAFNHTQFFGPAAVQGDFTNPSFGYVVNAAPPRQVQVALKFLF